MSNEPRRTLVVDRAFLDGFRKGSEQYAERCGQGSPERRVAEAQLSTVDAILRHGTTIPLDHLTVVELATPVREEPWQAAEREQFYSEADSTDADWTPSGGAA